MSGWVKWEKDLETDPRFRRMVKALHKARNAEALHHVTLLSGALLRMWVHADSHIREDNTLDMGCAEIDEYLGVPEFSSICCEDWLVEIDDGHVELPGFLEKNSAEAKKKALGNKRVANHRQRKRNAPALPDQTRPDQKRPDQKRPEEERERERAPEPLAVSRGAGVIDGGSRLTAMSAYGSLLEDWRRDIPECNPEAFAKWIVHVELTGRPMTPAMRLAQAKRLAGNGDFEAQAEVVAFCAENGYKALIPIADVRHRTRGRADSPEKQKLTWRPPPDEEPTRASG